MHACESRRIKLRQLLKHLLRIWRVRKVIEWRSKRFTGLQDIGLRNRRMIRAAACEKIAAKQRLCPDVEHVAAIPAVRKVGSVQPAKLPRPERQVLAVCERPPFSICNI